MAPRVVQSRAPFLQTRSAPRRWLEPRARARAQAPAHVTSPLHNCPPKCTCRTGAEQHPPRWRVSPRAPSTTPSAENVKPHRTGKSQLTTAQRHRRMDAPRLGSQVTAVEDLGSGMIRERQAAPSKAGAPRHPHRWCLAKTDPHKPHTRHSPIAKVTCPAPTKGQGVSHQAGQC